MCWENVTKANPTTFYLKPIYWSCYFMHPLDENARLIKLDCSIRTYLAMSISGAYVGIKVSQCLTEIWITRELPGVALVNSDISRISIIISINVETVIFIPFSMYGCPSRLWPFPKGEGKSKKCKSWKTTSFGCGIMENQYCNGRCNSLGSAASFVQNQRLAYKLVDMTTTGLLFCS